MTSDNFVFWINGYFELAKPEQIDKETTDMIRRHLELVFTNVTKKENQIYVRTPSDGEASIALLRDSWLQPKEDTMYC